ncbi:MAG: glutathione S-transferase [Salaquimonas sp.]
MKLYDGGRAPNPRRVQIFLKEKGIEIERVQMDINALEPRSESYSKLNPTKTVPALELDDGAVISETIAICRYFEELHPEPNLFGTTALEKAQIEMWQRRVELYFLLPVAFAFRHLHPGAKTIEPVQIAEWGEMNKVRAAKFMELLEAQLSKSEFIAGDRFTVADITLLTGCQFLRPARIEIPTEMIHLTEWFAKAAARPSAAFD